jgi:transposase
MPESEQICPECNDPLHRIGKEVVREELKIIPAKANRVQHVRHTYGCRRCEMEAEVPTIIKAPMPKPVIKGSFLSPESIAHLMVQKFVMGIPLYRQEKEFARQGIPLSRQTMSNGMIKATEDWLFPIYNHLHRQILERDLALADETEFQVLQEPGRKAQQKSYLWVYRTGNDGLPPIILCDYQSGRGHEHPKKFLSGFKGFLHTDGWDAYHKLPNITFVGCWAHARRKFDEALKTLPVKDREGTNAHRGKQYCDRLFDIERKLSELSAEERYRQRLQLSQPVLDEFFAWLSSFYDLGKSAFSRAVKYSLDQWKHLKNYLLDGRLEISNNRTERTIKMFVIDRKNFLFANTPRGAKASSVMFSIIQTALETGLNPFEYLVYIFRTAPNLDVETNPVCFESLLPQSFFKSLEN